MQSQPAQPCVVEDMQGLSRHAINEHAFNGSSGVNKSVQMFISGRQQKMIRSSSADEVVSLRKRYGLGEQRV